HGQDHRGLCDRVAEQVAADRHERELVHESARGADEDCRQYEEPGRTRWERKTWSCGGRGLGHCGVLPVMKKKEDGGGRIGPGPTPTRRLLAASGASATGVAPTSAGAASSSTPTQHAAHP